MAGLARSGWSRQGHELPRGAAEAFTSGRCRVATGTTRVVCAERDGLADAGDLAFCGDGFGRSRSSGAGAGVHRGSVQTMASDVAGTSSVGCGPVVWSAAEVFGIQSCGN